ncbi:MAG: hypothetical protein PWP45_661 [Tepidanaerobacteraceae bacterium]|nr:hypothetical protein [Tepidanaerobacteraceae bacterium]
MNWLDILLLVIFLKSAIEGFTRGFVLSAFRILGVLTALYVGLFYRDKAVDFLKGSVNVNEALMPALNMTGSRANSSALPTGHSIDLLIEMALSAVGFLAIFIAVQVLFAVLGFFINGMFRYSGLSFPNRILGLLLALLSTCLWVALVSSVITPFVMAWPGSIIERGIAGSYILQKLKFLDFITPVVIKLI